MERYLIINADDYGMCHSANAAVEDLFNNGFITSTTLMTPCPWAEDALRRAKNNKKMHVGLHLDLTSEWEFYRWGPVSRTPVPSLLDKRGYLPRECVELLKNATAEDVTTEINAQLDWMLSRDYRPTHVDNHMGSLYGLEGPSFLNEVFALCANNGFSFRLPRHSDSFGEDVPEELKNHLASIVSYAESLGIGLLDYLWNFGRGVTKADTYETVKERYLSIIRSMPEGVNELYVHPALESEELKAVYPGWQMRVWEHRLMRDDDLIKTIESEGIRLTTWIDAPLHKK